MATPSDKKSQKKASAKTGSKAADGYARPACPVVGIGASAGGLDAFKRFFSHMPDDSGVAFVLVPHLDPSHQSLMAELLSRHTGMPVGEIRDGMEVAANHVYIIPPGKYLHIDNSRLHLSKPPQQGRVETAIDHFLQSLADDLAERAIGIVLSGTSSHGSAGLQAIKASGGMVMVQQPDTAEYDAMPQNAIDTGVVDYILPPEQMPATLIRYVQHAYVSGAWEPLEPAKTELEELDRVLALLRTRTGYDFRYYRKNMSMRRVHRRMGLNQIDQLKNYCQFLRDSPDEAKRLFRDLLIGVTGFFREPEAYDVLAQRVIPYWLQRKDIEAPVRIWVPGCATGQEAYSLAMLLIETCSAAQKPLNLQIFATDIDETALEFARQGRYPVSIASEVSAERLSRFFTQTGSHYLINKQVRDCVVFAAQNLINDAPFSRLDLISCRNLLIYLQPEVQRKVITLFHFSLNEDGFLFLGSSETVGRHIDMFEPVSKKWRIFRRIGPVRRDIVNFPITTSFERRGISPSVAKPLPAADLNLAELTRRQLLDDYAPASALIDRKYQVLYFQGPTGDFLQQPSGEPTRDLITMARQGLQTKLRAACHKAVREHHTISDSSPRVKRNQRWYPCTITVKPLSEPKQAEGLLLVSFQHRETTESALVDSPLVATAAEESELVRQLEYELKATRDDLQSTIEDMENSNEELKASNEEIMSMNEELQSANEELETSKEELQSLNEELSTVNNQLQDKVEELDKAHNDMTNLLNSADIITLFLDTALCIRQFTPATGKLLKLIPSDVGRPISTFATDFTGEALLRDARKVLEKLTPVEDELSTSDGQHYLRRTQPYRTANNVIDGLVISFIDISERIRSDEQARRMMTVLQDSNDAITLLDLDGRITAWNHGAEQLYGYSEDEALKMNITDIVPADKQADMEKILHGINAGEQLRNFDSLRLNRDGKQLDVWVTLTPVYDDNGKPVAVATTERDISDRLELDALRLQADRLLRLVDHLPAGAVYREKDRLIMNRAAEKITGYSREELATPELWFHKLYGEREKDIRRLYQAERAADFPRQVDAIALTRKDGSQRYVEYAGYKFDDHEVWIMHDVSSHHASETALRDREQRLRAVMDNAAEAIVVIDSNGIISDYNNAAVGLFGYTAEEAISHKVNMLMPAPYREAHDGYMARYLQTRKPRIINQPRELPGRRKDGSIFLMELTITEIDHLGIFVGIIRDLEPQKTLERQVADISTREQERIGQEIHDGLGQQLTGLSMVATSIRRKLADRNVPEAAQLDELIAQLQLAIREARALSRGLSPVPVTPKGLTDALTMLARDTSTTTGIDCHFEKSSTVDIKDRTNAMQIYRIAQEAVNNAVKHAGASTINIRLEGRDDLCELTITDNGSGFDSDKALKEGLGLRIMHYRAGIIGCNLEIRSKPGKGTVIRCMNTTSSPAS